MSRNCRIAVYSLLAFLFLLSIDCQQKARGESEDTPQTIEFLISTVARSNLTFIRNGECHSCEEAARHIRDKYDYFRSKVKTPERFIHLCASKSFLSGEPYLVITAQGKVSVEKWLQQKLAEHKNSK